MIVLRGWEMIDGKKDEVEVRKVIIVIVIIEGKDEV